ncbi:SDR family NAD(P)-dependent oxidoreductase [Sphingomonas morindae]|uniref:SDR family NAD(P)-dependent oxidoreductase n=1 Tax=Sphingomonas morindae TaxID=1541170 RepID=A0ABY4XAT8_9SPHN|nr:SDR family NAD(P)-dependent oxidoreductase [Sphingomonas morindae]USI73805.1 SDR family NAD(P)-dependent oxidoreductase [Sphingomonas morindae]
MQEAKGTALVTGASAGIGAVYAERLARRGHDVILAARDTARLTALAERLRTTHGVGAEIVTADLTRDADVAALEARLAQDPAITLLVNNAGITLKGGLLDNDAEAITRLIALNVTAPTRLATAAARAFSARKAGAIVNIASVLAVAPELFEGAYSGTKAYLLNLSLALAAQLAESGVRVQAVLPGATRTEIWEKSGASADALPPEWVMEADVLVDAALLGLDRGEVVTIPPLADEGLWQAYDGARRALAPHLSRREVAPRYRS